MGSPIDNRQAIIDYLQAGAKGMCMGGVGVEIEQFVLDEDGERVPYTEKHGRLGVSDILEALAEFYPNVSRTDAGNIMGCSRPAASVTIEPGAQIELSMAPLSNVAEVEAEYKNFEFRLKQIIEPHGYSLAPFGYSPVGKAADIELIPKPRYRFMDEYFSQLEGMHAERMMRASASLQVSIDFADEADAVRKMRIATLLGPVISWLADNCPVFEGASNTRPLRRMEIWRQVDPARCQVVPGLFDVGFGFGSYTDWLLATPPIFSTKDGEHATGNATTAEVYQDAPMTQDDIEHVLGMFWPDVRLKHYVEIRQADALPLGPALGLVALIKGIFYSTTNLDILENALGVCEAASAPAVSSAGIAYSVAAPAAPVADRTAAPVADRTAPAPAWPYAASDVEDAIAAIAAHAGSARIYGREVVSWAELLFQIAPDGLSASEVGYLQELVDFRGL